MTLVAVTGADGFIGSHLVQALVREGYDVRALAMYNAQGNVGWLADCDERNEIDVRLGDIRDTQICDKFVSGADVVYNLAALIGIPYSYEAVESYIATNITGTANLCHAALKAGSRLFVQMSTSEVYGTALTVPIDETHPLQPQSPYSATKIAADALVRSFWSSFGLPAIVARPFNTYGPRQSMRAFIPTVITQLLRGVSELSIGDTTPTRDLTYVEDTVRALVSLDEHTPNLGDAVNIGTGNEYSVGDVIDLLQEIAATDVQVSTDPARLRPERSEVRRLVCDNSHLQAIGGYVPTMDLREGLQATFNWFKAPENLSKYSFTGYQV